jgi:hypothetical protein
VKLSLDEQKHFIRRLTDKVVEGAEKTKQLFFACLCALASLREIVYFFTASRKRCVATREAEGGDASDVAQIQTLKGLVVRYIQEGRLFSPLRSSGL